MALTDWLPYVSAALLFAAAGFFYYRLRGRSDESRTMAPIAAYMGAIGLFFVFNGYAVFATTSCPAVDCTELSSGVVVVLASAFIVSYPLRDVWPSAAVWVSLGLAWIAVTVEGLLALVAPELVLDLAYAFAGVVLVLVVVGYLGYVVLLADDLTLLSPNVAAVVLILVATVPLAGVALDQSLLSLALAPAPLLGSYLFFDRVELGDIAGSVDPDAAP